MYLFVSRTTGMMAEANVRITQIDKRIMESGGNVIRWATSEYDEVMLEAATFPLATIKPTTTPNSDEKTRIDRFSVKNMVASCLKESPRALIIDASFLRSCRLTKVAKPVATEAAKMEKTTPTRWIFREPVSVRSP